MPAASRARHPAVACSLDLQHPPAAVIAAGHSLGGAQATLAALDIVHELQIPREHLCVYTFGAPRVGNHMFATLYNKVRCGTMRTSGTIARSSCVF